MSSTQLNVTINLKLQDSKFSVIELFVLKSLLILKFILLHLPNFAETYFPIMEHFPKSTKLDIPDFKLSPCYKCCILFWVIPRHLNIMCRRFGTSYIFHLHGWTSYEDGIGSSETSTHKIQAPWHHPKEIIQQIRYYFLLNYTDTSPVKFGHNIIV
jgi:hypothetical protein